MTRRRCVFFLGIFCNLGNLGSIWMGGLDLCWIFT